NLKLLADLKPDLVVVSDSTSSTQRRMLNADSGEGSSLFAKGAQRAYADLAALGLDNLVVVEAPPSANCKPEGRFSSPQACSSDATTELVRSFQLIKTSAAAKAGLD